MVLEEYEINTIIEALDSYHSNALYGDVISNQIRKKIETIQSQSKNKRYSLRSTDWLSEAAKKRKKKEQFKLEGGLL